MCSVCRTQQDAFVGGHDDGRKEILTELFETLDFNGSGTVSWPEYEAMGRVLHGARYDHETHFYEFRLMDTDRSGDVAKHEWLQHFRSNTMLSSLGPDEFRNMIGKFMRAAAVAKQHYDSGGFQRGGHGRVMGGGMGMGSAGGSMMGGGAPRIGAPGGGMVGQGMVGASMSGAQAQGLMGQAATANAYGMPPQQGMATHSMSSGMGPGPGLVGAAPRSQGFNLLPQSATQAFNPYDMQRMMAFAEAFAKASIYVS